MRTRPGRHPYSAIPRPAAATERTDISETIDPPDGPHDPPRWQQKQIAAQSQAAAAMGTLEQMEQHLGGILSATRAVPKSDVLGQRTLTIGAHGFHTERWPVNFQSVNIINLSSLPLVASTAGELTQAPTLGTGIASIPPGTDRMVTLRGTELTLYGVPGQTFEVTAFARPRPPYSALISNGAGAGTLLAPGQTATTTSTLKGLATERLVIVLNVAATTGGVTLGINGVTPNGYTYPLLFGDVAEVTVAGVTPYRIGPALTPSPGAVANDVVPPIVQVIATVAGSAAYGIDYIAGS